MLRSAACGIESKQLTLERRARHHAVLDGEQTEQPQIDQERRSQRRGRRRVERLRHHEVADEPDGIEITHQEHGVGNHSVDEYQQSAHHMPPFDGSRSAAG